MTLRPLRSVAEVRVSNVDKKTVDGERAVRLVNYTDVYYNRLLDHRHQYMPATASASQVGAFALRPGDSVITKDSETAADIGIAAYIQQSAPDLLCGYHLAIVRPRPSVDPRFLNWQLSSSFVRDQLAVRATGVTRFGLTYGAIRGVLVHLPSVAEQHGIADFLDDQVAALTPRALPLASCRSCPTKAPRLGS